MDALATPVVGVLADKYGTKKAWHLAGEQSAFLYSETLTNIHEKGFPSLDCR